VIPVKTRRTQPFKPRGQSNTQGNNSEQILTSLVKNNYNTNYGLNTKDSLQLISDK